MRSGILALAFGCCLAVMEQQSVQSQNSPNANQDMTAPGVKTLPSHYSVHETVDRLEGLLKSKGIRIFARIDQAAEAQAVGLSMRPTELLIFGDPKTGTPLMNEYPSLAIDR
jgi:uncharacterized protein (DUF302 family)